MPKIKKDNPGNLQKIILTISIVNFLGLGVLYYFFFMAQGSLIAMSESSIERLHVLEPKVKCLETQDKKDYLNAKNIHLSFNCHEGNPRRDPGCDRRQEFRNKYLELLKERS